MKKISYCLSMSLMLIGLNAEAFISSGALPFSISIPDLKEGVLLKAEGMLPQTTFSTPDHVNYLEIWFPSTPTTNNIHAVSDDMAYSFQFLVGAGYLFGHSGNDIQLDWSHFDQGSGSAYSVELPAMIPVGFITGPDFHSPTLLIGGDGRVLAKNHINSEFDAIDLTLGQSVSFGSRLVARFYGGLQYAQIEEGITNYYLSSSQLVPPNNFSETDQFSSQFEGIGPRLGVETTYGMGGGFGVRAHGGGVLLVGETQANTVVNTDFPVFPEQGPPFYEDQTSSLGVDEQFRVVPGWDAELGIYYTLPFNQGKGNALFEFGYKVTEYVDVVDRYDINPLFVWTDSESGVGFNGPYFRVMIRVC